MRFGRFFSLILVLCTFLAAPSSSQTFSGNWDTNMGAMQLQQSGTSLSGSYSGQGQVTGTVNGTYARGTYVNGSYRGEFEFTLSPDGRNFSGRWWRPGRDEPWTGTRIGAAPVTPSQPVQPQPQPGGTASVDGFWRVEDATDGRNYNYHPVPWQFLPDGTVRAGNLWSGSWTRQANGVLHVQIFSNGQVADAFVLVLDPTARSFTASRNGIAYRYGDRM